MKDPFDLAREILPLDEAAMAEARRIQDNLTKPRGSLGKLETLSVQLAGIYRTPTPALRKKVVFTMAADHGVTCEGVSAYPSEVTAQMVLNFARGGAAINVLSRAVGAEVKVVDVGVASDMNWPRPVINRKIARGTRNMAVGPAMSPEEARQALSVGCELAIETVEDGANALAIGDMGIGNTTAASAMTSVFTGRPVAEVTGRGTGIEDEVFRTKVKVIKRALDVNKPRRSEGLDVLAKVGGLEIGGMAGVIIGGAHRRVPVFIDGFVAGSAALVAASLNPLTKYYMVASHLSVEPGHRFVLEHLGLTPLLDLGMRLGEGTGAALAFFIAESSCKVLSEMATFDKAGVARSNKEATE